MTNPTAPRDTLDDFIVNMRNGYYASFDDGFATAKQELQAYITKQLVKARIDELNLANDIILSGKVTAGYYEEAKQYIKNRLKQLRKAK